MISAEEVQKEILALEKKDTSYAVIERLAWLYVVSDHLNADKAEVKRLSKMEGSDFLKSCEDKPIDLVLSILDEHMGVLKALYPKEHSAIIRKINEL